MKNLVEQIREAAPLAREIDKDSQLCVGLHNRLLAIAGQLEECGEDRYDIISRVVHLEKEMYAFKAKFDAIGQAVRVNI